MNNARASSTCYRKINLAVINDVDLDGNHYVKWNGAPGPDGFGGWVGDTAGLKPPGSPVVSIEATAEVHGLCATVTGSIAWYPELPPPPPFQAGATPIYGPRPAQVVSLTPISFKNILDVVGAVGGFVSTFSRDGTVAMTWTSRAEPLDADHPEGQWEYRYTVVNSDPVAHEFSNTLQPGFSGTIGAADTAEYGPIIADAPTCLELGSFTMTDRGDIFPITGPVPTGCAEAPGVPVLSGLGMGVLVGVLSIAGVALLARRRRLVGPW